MGEEGRNLMPAEQEQEDILFPKAICRYGSEDGMMRKSRGRRQIARDS